MSKPTSREIAKLAGVSPSAVSIAINGKPGISEQTRERILNIARHYNYCTNSTSARVLRERSIYIAVLFRTDAQLIDQAFYSECNLLALDVCRKLGYSLVSTYITGEDSALELPPAIRYGEVDGVLIFGDQKPSIYAELINIGIPFVIVDSCNRSTPYPSIYVDYSEAAYRATKYLIDLGHRDIAFLSSSEPHEFGKQILTGFQRATMEANITLYPNRIQMDFSGAEAMLESVRHALSGPQRPTAIFCFEDLTALKVIRMLSESGIRVPEDISVIGIDGINYGKLSVPSLTTVRVDKHTMINEALQMLSSMIKGETCSSHMLSTPELEIGESTAPITK